MLYSIGYQDRKIKDFIDLLKSRNIEFLLDVRSRPSGRNPNFRQAALKRHLEMAGVAYSWGGETLGGWAKIKECEIRRLAKWQANKTACLMCMEADPKACHRDYEIARRLVRYGVEVIHII